MSSHRNVWLPCIANELVDEILSYLDAPDRNAMVRTCWNLHCVSARRLYMHVSVTTYKARRFFKTIGESRMNYGMYTRSLEYSAASNTDAWLTYVLFRDALSHFPQLGAMTLAVRSELSPLLQFLIKKSTSSNMSEDPDAGTYHGPPGKFPLERLQILHLHGDLRMLKLFNLQSISTMCLSEPLEEEDFLYFLHAAITNQEGNNNTSLKDLTITFDEAFHNRNDMAYIINSLSQHFPNVCILNIRCPRINALKISSILAANPHTLPMLQEFRVNDLSLVEPFMYVRSEDECIAIQRKHVNTFGISHPNLTRIGFGPIQWARFDQYNAWKYSKYVYPEDSLDDLSPTVHNALLYEVSYDMEFDMDI